jgi:hypothetical protein
MFFITIKNMHLEAHGNRSPKRFIGVVRTKIKKIGELIIYDCVFLHIYCNYCNAKLEEWKAINKTNKQTKFDRTELYFIIIIISGAISIAGYSLGFDPRSVLIL